MGAMGTGWHPQGPWPGGDDYWWMPGSPLGPAGREARQGSAWALRAPCCPVLDQKSRGGQQVWLGAWALRHRQAAPVLGGLA